MNIGGIRRGPGRDISSQQWRPGSWDSAWPYRRTSSGAQVSLGYLSARWNKWQTDFGISPVLILLKAMPNRPLLVVSDTNWAETWVAISMAWPLTDVPRWRCRYRQFQKHCSCRRMWYSTCSRAEPFQFLDLAGSKITWLFCWEAGRLVENTHLR